MPITGSYRLILTGICRHLTCLGLLSYSIGCLYNLFKVVLSELIALCHHLLEEFLEPYGTKASRQIERPLVDIWMDTRGLGTSRRDQGLAWFSVHVLVSGLGMKHVGGVFQIGGEVIEHGRVSGKVMRLLIEMQTGTVSSLVHYSLLSLRPLHLPCMVLPIFSLETNLHTFLSKHLPSKLRLQLLLLKAITTVVH